MNAADAVPVLIRRAGAADVPTLLPLCAAHAAYERLPQASEQRLDALARALQGEPPPLYAWIAFAAEQAVGYASATLDFSTLDRASYLHLDCLYVAAGWRNRSIGAALWERARTHALDLGCRAIQWQTPAWNIDAARFYRRLGATETAKRRYSFRLREGD